MPDKETTQTKTEEAPPAETPFDEIIARVTQYRDKPELATPETMQALLDDLMDLKPFVDGENEMEEGHEGSAGKGGLTIVLGELKKRGK